MTCQQLIDFLADYLDGDLPADVRLRFDSHLGVCRDCRNYLGQYKASVELAKSLGQDPQPEIPPKLAKAIKEAMSQ